MAADLQKEQNGPIILIVDDVPENTKFLEIMLGELGYQPRSANTGKEALQMVEEEKPDLILLDIQMPEVDPFGSHYSGF